MNENSNPPIHTSNQVDSVDRRLILNSAEGLATANCPRSKFLELPATLVGWLRHHGLRATLRSIRDLMVPFDWQAWQWTGCDTGELPPGMALDTDLATLRRLRVGLHDVAHDFFLDEIDGCRTCVYATIDGNLSSIAWVHDYRQAGPFLRLNQGQVEIRGLFTLPTYRGRRLGQVILSNMCVTLAHGGVKEIYSTINGRNVASQKVVRASGWKLRAVWKRPAIFGPRYDCSIGRVETWGEAIRGLFR